MSTANAMADVQTGQEVVLPERTPSELTVPKFTATQIETDCPKLAKDQAIAVEKLIAEVKALCDVGGFAAFREKFFPKLGKSRVYELLAIGTNKKSNQEIKAGTRGRVAKHRAKKAAASVSVTVTENPDPVGPSVPTENGAVQATSTAVQRTPQPTEMRSSGMPSPKVVFEVTARVDDLIRRIDNWEPTHFTGIGNPTDGIVKLGIFLLDVANLKEPGIVKLMPIVARPDSGVSAEQPAEVTEVQIRARDTQSGASVAGSPAAVSP